MRKLIEIVTTSLIPASALLAMGCFVDPGPPPPLCPLEQGQGGFNHCQNGRYTCRINPKFDDTNTKLSVVVPLEIDGEDCMIDRTQTELVEACRVLCHDNADQLGPNNCDIVDMEGAIDFIPGSFDVSTWSCTTGAAASASAGSISLNGVSIAVSGSAEVGALANGAVNLSVSLVSDGAAQAPMSFGAMALTATADRVRVEISNAVLRQDPASGALVNDPFLMRVTAESADLGSGFATREVEQLLQVPAGQLTGTITAEGLQAVGSFVDDLGNAIVVQVAPPAPPASRR